MMLSVNCDDPSVRLDVVENCVPYEIRLHPIRSNLTRVSWWQTSYHSALTPDSVHWPFAVWHECINSTSEVRVRLGRQGPFTTLEPDGHVEIVDRLHAKHTVWITQAFDEVIVGSEMNGWSDIYSKVKSHYITTTCRPYNVHTAYGRTGTARQIQYSTAVECGNQILPFRLEPMGQVHIEQEHFVFEDGGVARRRQNFHLIRLTGLEKNTTYQYRIGGSIPYHFQTEIQDNKGARPQRFAVLGDIGYQNAVTVPPIQRDVADGRIDGVLTVGDYAYDMDMRNGQVGDLFMEEIEPIAAYVPFMVAMGNHEAAYNFSHYTQRFRLMPLYKGSLLSVQFYSEMVTRD